MPHPPKLEVSYERPANLKANPRNARRHSEKQIAQIKASIIAFGFTNPVLVDEHNRVIAGHGRLQAAIELGLETIPVIQISHLNIVQKRALAIADNKIALNSSWDLEILSEELKILSSPDLEIDVSITGFETAEIDLIIDGPDVSPQIDPADKIPKIDRSKPAITQMGDLWELGPHRIVCGNALEMECYVRLMNGEKADMAIADSPYNVKIDGHVSGLGQAHHREFAMASGEMTSAQFTTFLRAAMANMVASTVDGSIHFHFMDWRHMQEILAAGTAVYTELKNLCVWNKTNGGMGSLYRSKHEFVYVFKNGTAPHSLSQIHAIAREHGALLHCDAAQAPCAMDLSGVSDMADLISLSAHKMYGPKGIGALYVRRQLQRLIEPIIHGGGQQSNLRSGTLPTPLCVGFGAAAELISKSASEERARIRRQRNLFLSRLLELPWSITSNGGHGDSRHPGNANVQFAGFSGHDLLGVLQPNLAASTGSACGSGIPEPSHVLRAIGLTDEQASASVRFCIGRRTTDADIHDAVELISGALSQMLEAGLRQAAG